MLKICELWHSNGYIRFYFFNVFDLLFIFFLYAEKCTERSFITCTSVLKGSNNQGIFLKYNKSKYSFLFIRSVDLIVSWAILTNFQHVWIYDTMYLTHHTIDVQLDTTFLLKCRLQPAAKSLNTGNVLIVFIGKCQCFENV